MSIFDALKSQNAQPNIFNTVKNVGQNQLLTTTQQSVNKELKELREKSQLQTQAQLGSAMLTLDRLNKYKTDLNEALDTITNTVTRLNGIDNRLSSMLEQINKAAESSSKSDFNPELYARSFDSYIKSIASQAESTRVSPNLLASSTLDFEYPANSPGGYRKVSGNQLSPTYTIKDGDGLTWAADAPANLLRQYEEYPGKTTNNSVSFYKGVRVDSIDNADNITFTIGTETADPKTFSGTIDRDGLGLLHSWGYDGLATEAGRARATEETKGAKDIVFFEKNRFEMIKTTLKFYLEASKTKVDGVNADIMEIQTAAAMDLAEKEQNIMQRYRVSQSRIAHAYVIRNQFSSLIPQMGGTMSKIFNILS